MAVIASAGPAARAADLVANVRAGVLGVRLGEGWHYDRPEDFVLRHGAVFMPGPLPQGSPFAGWRGTRSSHSNAQLLACGTEGRAAGLLYVEGFAQERDLPIPMEHAWCVDPAGRVVDATWRDAPGRGVVYVGVGFTTALVADALRQRGRPAALINSWQEEWPLLRRRFVETAAFHGLGTPVSDVEL